MADKVEKARDSDPNRRKLSAVFAAGGLVFSLTCLPMEADAATSAFVALCEVDPGPCSPTDAATVSTLAFTAADDYPDVTDVEGAGGASASQSVGAYTDGIAGPVTANATADVNELSVSVDTGGAGAGSASAYFSDVLTVTGSPGVSFTAAVTLITDISISNIYNVQLYPELEAYVYGPGTLCDAADLLDCVYGGSDLGIIGGILPPPVVVPLEVGDTVVLVAGLEAVANSGGGISDPASVTITGLPPGVELLSASGARYTVPEPPSLVLLASGLIGLGAWVRLRSRIARSTKLAWASSPG